MRPLPGHRHRAVALAAALAAATLVTSALPAGAAPLADAAQLAGVPGLAGAAPPRPLGATVVPAPVPLATSAAPLAGVPGASAPTRHAPPVDAAVSDPFRPPANPYGAGNRGIDFATVPGTPVRASAAGQVTFAGPVGGSRHVVVLHPDGLRTSYSFLATTVVLRGQPVAAGEVVGTSGPSLHFGARAGDRYVDPSLLLGGAAVEVHLVPLEDRVPGSADVERRWLVRGLAAAAGTSAEVARWLGAGGAAVAAGATTLAGDALVATGRGFATPVLVAQATVAARRTAAELLEDQAGCTPSSALRPTGPRERRIVVLVAGYGSSGGDADILDVDTVALGYAGDDRVQFSYAGGRVAGVGGLAGVPATTYGPADAMGDLVEAGARLRRLLDDVAAAHPGVPIDVVAHSQGGLVAREALTAPTGAPAPPVANLVTLGTPHHGAAAASVAGALGLRSPDSALGAGLAAATGGAVDPRAPAVVQLAPGSAFLRALERRGLPAGVAVTSVAAVGDVVVPAVSSTLAGATHALVPLAGPAAHGRLPGSAEAADALALALSGRAPACAAAAVLVAGAAAAAAVEAAEHGLGAAVAPGVAAADRLVSALAAAAR